MQSNSLPFSMDHLKSCILVVDILEICICVFVEARDLILTELRHFKLSHFRKLFCIV